MGPGDDWDGRMAGDSLAAFLVLRVPPLVTWVPRCSLFFGLGAYGSLEMAAWSGRRQPTNYTYTNPGQWVAKRCTRVNRNS